MLGLVGATVSVMAFTVTWLSCLNVHYCLWSCDLFTLLDFKQMKKERKKKVYYYVQNCEINETCGPPVSGSWSFRVIDWTVVDGLLLRARRPGICYQTVFVTSTGFQHFQASSENSLFAKNW